MKTIACAICGEHNSAFLFSKWGFNLVQCRRCKLTYVNPRNFRTETDDYFEGPYLESVECDGKLRPAIQVLYSEILRNLSMQLVPACLLDVGCAMGHFMVFARDRGWNVQGVECSRHAAAYGSRRWGVRIQSVCELHEARLPENSFDACTFIEVAEHLPHPRAAFTEALRVLKPGGMIYITTPNFASFRSLVQRENWKTVIPTGHLYYFTAESLSKLLEMIGFTRIANLTAPADFASELEASRTDGGVRLSEPELTRIRSETAAEDAPKLTNGRAEGLVICAVKPHSGAEATASLRYSGPLPPLENKLVRVPSPTPEDQKVYLIRGWRKHWVTSVEWLHRHGRRLEETVEVQREILNTIFPGPPL
jgi:SAM-dependent methyltransferase